MTLITWVVDHFTSLVTVAVMISTFLNGRKLKALHIEVNSRLSQLLVATGASEHARGTAEGRAAAQTEDATR